MVFNRSVEEISIRFINIIIMIKLVLGEQVFSWFKKTCFVDFEGLNQIEVNLRSKL